MSARSRFPLLAALLPLLACGGDSSSPTEPPTPGDPPTVSAVVLGGVSSGNVPLPVTVRVTVGGDSLARLLVLFEGQTDTVAPIPAMVFDVKDTVRAVGAHSATVILQSAAGRADTAVLAVTGTNPLPVITGATLSADSTEVTDSVRLRVTAHDNRGGVSVVTEFEGVRDSTYSPDTLLTRDRWLRRGTAGSVPVLVRVRDTDGGLSEVGRTARFFVIPPSGELRVPVRADTAPLVIAATVLLHRATVAYDSVRIDIGTGKSQLFTGLGRVDSVTVHDTLTEVGVTGVTARWYHPSGNALLKDSVEVLLVPNQPPSGELVALDDTVNEGVGARFRLTFTDDRGVREARFFRVANGITETLLIVPLADALIDTSETQLILTPGQNDTIEVVLEDRDGLTYPTRATAVYTDKRPVIASAVLSPGSVVYSPTVTLGVALAVEDEDPSSLNCSGSTSQGKVTSGGTQLLFGVDNPSAAADSARVSATVQCVDPRGQISAVEQTTAVTVLHSVHTQVHVYDVTSGLTAARNLLVNGTSMLSENGLLDLYLRNVSSLSLQDEDTKWIAAVTPQALIQYNTTTGAVTVPVVDGTATSLYVIPNTSQALTVIAEVARLTANDTDSLRVVGYQAGFDRDPAPGLQIAVDYWDLTQFGPAPDSASVQRLRNANKALESEINPLLPESRRVTFTETNDPSLVTVSYIYKVQGLGFGGTQLAGVSPVTLYQFWRGRYNMGPAGFFQCIDQLFALTPRLRGIGLNDEQIFIRGVADPFSYLSQYFSFDTCELTAAGKTVMMTQALFSNRVIK